MFEKDGVIFFISDCFDFTFSTHVIWESTWSMTASGWPAQLDTFATAHFKPLMARAECRFKASPAA